MTNTGIKDSFSLFCGIISHSDAVWQGLPDDHFIPWLQLVEEEIEVFKLSEVMNYYYQPFIHSLFPERFENARNKTAFLSAKQKRFRQKLDAKIDLIIEGQPYTILIEFIDLYLLPQEFSIVALKVNHLSNDAGKISRINGFLRDYENNYINGFLHSEIFGYLDGPFQFHGNKLKVFTYLETDQMDDISRDQLLYDIGTCSPVGTAAGHFPANKPSANYFKTLLEENTICVFNSWKALCLFDSFTVASEKESSYPIVWEYSYFSLIYIHSLFVKYFLFDLNKKFHDTNNKNTGKLDQLFRQFDHHFNQKTISFNFLPQLIYEKLRHALQIEQEMQIISSNIRQSHQYEEERRNKRLNMFFALIAIFTFTLNLMEIKNYIDLFLLFTDFKYLIATAAFTGIVFIFIYLYFLFSRKR